MTFTQLLQYDFGPWFTNTRSTRQSNISLSDVDCAMIETRSSKPLRSEIQVLSQLCWDDTPEVDINSARFSRDWFHRTSTVLRNAYVLCGMCDLQVFKAFDAKIAEHTFVQLDAELGLRHVVAQEFFNADKKIWNAIAQLYSQGSWTFKECLNEMSVVRPDISSLYYSHVLEFAKLFLHLVMAKAKEAKLKEEKGKVEREKPSRTFSTQGTNAPTASTTTRR